MRVDGQFKSEESLRNVNLRVSDRFFRLTDIGTITRGYADPPQPVFRFNGQPAIGLAVGMKANGDVLQFGEALKRRMAEIVAELPIGVGVHLVSDQPAVVEKAVGGFTEALFEAVGIVLIVSFISLGLGPAWSSPAPSRWFSRSLSSSCIIPGSRCNACRWARSSSRSGCSSTTQ